MTFKSTLFEKAENLIETGEFQEAFEIFHEISLATEATNNVKADALNMMGLIVWSMAPELAHENEAEEGLAYFKQALKLDPKNLGALLNVAENFGTAYGQHQDTEIFTETYQQLQNLKSKLSEADLAMLKDKHQLLARLIT